MEHRHGPSLTGCNAVAQWAHWPHVFRLFLHLCLVSSRSRLAALQLLKTEKIVATCIRRFESCGLHCPTTSATSTHSGMQTNNDYVHCVWKVNLENIYSPKTIDQAFFKKKKELEIKTWVITPQQNRQPLAATITNNRIHSIVSE